MIYIRVFDNQFLYNIILKATKTGRKRFSWMLTRNLEIENV